MSTTQQPPAQPTDPESAEPKRRKGPPTWVIIAGVVLVIWAIVAALPSSSSDPTDYSNPDQAIGGYTAPIASSNSDQQIYLAAVNATAGGYYTDQRLLAIGRAVCSAFDRGVSWGTIVADGMSSNVNSYDIGVIVGGAVSALCPEYEGELP
jgi:hypothetical protein